MKFLIKIFLLFFVLNVFSQDIKKDSVAVKIDSLYREDQFYFNFAYGNLQKFPSGLNQIKFSPALSFGFLRDFPISKNRNFAVAIGLGYATTNYNHNLYQYKSIDGNGNESTTYEILSDDIFYQKNKQSFHYLEVPFEIRWRNSTYTSHKFWRIYTGFKVSYLLLDKYKFVNEIQTIVIKNNPDLNKFQYGCYLTAGWNTWNVYVYYSLNPIFKSAVINNQNIKMNTLNVGLQFYIL